jgi:predicted metal-dependent peptidase
MDLIKVKDIFIKELLAPKLDWRNMMKQFMVSTAKSDMRWFPSNRRFVHRGLYLPSNMSDSLGDVVVVVDNSGSTLEYQQRFFTECNDLLQQYDMNMHLRVVDMNINDYKVYNKGDARVHTWVPQAAFHRSLSNGFRVCPFW